VGISPGKGSQAFVRDRGLTVQMEDGDVAGLFAETVCKLPVPVSRLIQWSIADSSGISAWLFDFWERVLTRMVVLYRMVTLSYESLILGITGTRNEIGNYKHRMI
jgi:hypothetical protein